MFYFFLQRQDTDERLRRLQTEKESMALQVQVLTEQVSAQSDKIADMERIILDKTQQMSHSEDLLQRVNFLMFIYLFQKKCSVLPLKATTQKK